MNAVNHIERLKEIKKIKKNITIEMLTCYLSFGSELYRKPTAKVTAKCTEPKSYEIITKDGTSLWKNRIHVRPFKTPAIIKAAQDSGKGLEKVKISNFSEENVNQSFCETGVTLNQKQSNLINWFRILMT